MICSVCQQEMTDPVGCKATMIVKDGYGFPRNREYHDYSESKTCHDCGAPHGTFHHPGCDIERCPICDRQLIGCECFDEELPS